MQTVINKAIETYQRLKFLEDCDTAYAALQQDPDAWKDYQDELKSFEGTLMDGLDPNKNRLPDLHRRLRICRSIA